MSDATLHLDNNEKPSPQVKYNFNAIPQEFLQYNNWLLWKYEFSKGRWTKVPYQTNGRKADSTDPKTWCSFAEAVKAYASGKFDGIGFAIGDTGLICIDVDHISLWDFMAAIDSILDHAYVERSPSGNGLHLWLKAEKPNNKCKSKNFHNKNVEVYNSDRFITMTGADGDGEITECQSAFDEAFKDLFYPATTKTVKSDNVITLSMDDEQIVSRIMNENSLGREMWVKWHEFGLADDEDPSSSDMGYLNKIAFYTKDAQQIERIWLSSAIGSRDKTQTRKDYRQRTIEKAIADTESYQPQVPAIPATPVVNKVEPRESDPFGLMDVDITKPHGLLGDMCESMTNSAHRKLPEAYPLYGLQTLAMLAMVAGTRSFTGGKLNLITLLIAPTASGKENGQAFFDDIASQLGLSKYTFNKPRSDKDLITNMVETEGMCAYSIDEAHGLFDAMNNKNAQSYQVAMGAEMLTMATKSNYVLSGNHRREFRGQYETKLARYEAALEKLDGDDRETQNHKGNLENKIRHCELTLEAIETGFKHPLINMAMASTPEKIDKVVSSETIESGLMGRSLVVRADEERAELNLYPSPELCSVDTINKLKNVLLQCGNVSISPEASKLYEKVVIYYDRKMRNHSTLGGLYARIGDRAVVIASLLGAASGEVTEQDMKYAFASCLRHIEDCRFLLVKANAVETGDYDSKLLEVKERVLKFCTKVGISRSSLKQKVCKPKDIAKLVRRAETEGKPTIYTNAINQLMKDGMIVLEGERFKKV